LLYLSLTTLTRFYPELPNAFNQTSALADVPACAGDDSNSLRGSKVDYFKRLDQASDRLVFEELSKSTMGKPFVMATISSPATRTTR
jgi:hypothetical protein